MKGKGFLLMKWKMKILLSTVKKLRKSEVKKQVDKRLKEFKALNKKGNKAWFCELCFCILTANSKAETAMNIQKEVSAHGFCTWCLSDIRGAIKRNKHRFHNNKAKFIVEARKHIEIKDKIKKLVAKDGQIGAREWLVKNIKGLGYKEASHFLRNVGYFDVAILDRHILSLMNEDKKALTKKRYLEIEKRFRQLAGKLGMKCGELDLYMWYMKTGRVMK